jgi:hypothetical protein
MSFLNRKRGDDRSGRVFETKSHAWAQVGLAGQLSQRAAQRARRQMYVLAPLLIAVIVLYTYREQLFGLDMPIRILTVIAIVAIGWALARDVGRAAGPVLFRRMDPATAGTTGFLIRLATIGVVVLIALRVSGIEPRTLAVGGAFTAVVLGLAAQQTLGNLIAGMVLLSARPFRVGERVRFQGGGVAGSVEGIVSSLGLLYTVLANGDDRIMVPNSSVLSMAVMPLREPDAIDLLARLRSDVRPSDVQAQIDEGVSVKTRRKPHIALEEFDGDEVVVRITATPSRASEGPKLADEVLAAIAGMTRDGTAAHAVASAVDDDEDPDATIRDVERVR